MIRVSLEASVDKPNQRILSLAVASCSSFCIVTQTTSLMASTQNFPSLTASTTVQATGCAQINRACAPEIGLAKIAVLKHVIVGWKRAEDFVKQIIAFVVMVFLVSHVA